MSGIVSQLTHLQLQEGRQTVAYDAYKKMAKAVKENEPGCLMYAVTRGNIDPLEIYIYGVFENEAALQAHGRTDHMRELQASRDSFLVRGNFNVEMLDEVGGFIRGADVALEGQMGE